MKTKFWKAGFRLSTLRSRLLFSAICFLLLTLISIGALSYYFYSGTAIQKIYESNQNHNRAMVESISTIIQDTVDYCDTLLADEQLNDLIQKLSATEVDSDATENFKKLNYRLFSAMEYRKEIAGIEIINGQRSILKGDIPNLQYHKLSELSSYKQLTQNVRKAAVLYDDQGRDPFINEAVGENVYVAGVSENSPVQWMLVLKINPAFLGSKEQSDRSLVLDGEGRVIWTNVDEDREKLLNMLSQTDLLKSEGNFKLQGASAPKYVSYSNSNYNGWIFASIMDSRQFEAQRNKVLLFTVLAALFLFLCFTAISYYISTRLVRPLTRLGEQIRNIRDSSSGAEEEDGRRIGEYWLNKINFKAKLMLFYSSLIVLSSLLFILAFYRYSQGFIISQVVDAANQSMRQAAKNIDFIMSRNERVSTYISINESIQELMKGDWTGESPAKDISSYIINEGFLKKGISYVDLYGADWNKLYSTGNGGLSQSPVDSELIRNFKESTFHKQWLRMKEGVVKDFTISFVRKVRYGIMARDRYKVIGYLDLGIDEGYLEEKYGMLKWGDKGRTFILDGAGKIISSVDKKLIGQSIGAIIPGGPSESVPDSLAFRQGSDTMYLLSSPVQSFGWRLISILPEKDLLRDYIQVLTSNVVALFIIVLIMLEIINIFANWISRPIYIIKRSLNEIRIGNLDVGLEYRGKDEFGALCDSFRDLMGRMDSLFNELYEGKLREKDLENRKKEAQLICLQHQINPHFLYNTFTSIKFLIKMGRMDEAAEMVTMVGDMFRIGVYRGKMMVDVKEELEHVRTYLVIQQIRYREKLSVEWEIDPEVYGFKTVKFILQPLLENAIFHGIEPMDRPGSITVRAQKRQDRIYFEVADNGPGIGEDKLKAIDAQLQGKEQAGSIGLLNVDERIKMYFGDAYGLKVESSAGTGTRVSVLLPAVAQDH